MFASRKFYSVLVLAIILLFSLSLLAGCGQSGNQQNSSDSSQSDEQSADALKDTGEKFPDKPIEIIVSYGPGGLNDNGARYIAPMFSKALGVPVNVRNMEGNGGRLGREYVWDAEPDGYTLLSTGAPSTVVGQLLRDAKYDTLGFEYIGNYWGGDYRIVIVPEDSPYQTWEDLLNASKEKDLKGASSGGYGSTSHLQSLILTVVAGLEHEFIPFDGDAEAAEVVMGGHADFAMVAGLPVIPMIESGRIRAIAVHGPERMDALSDVPTFDELGIKGAVLATTTGIVAPPGTPKDCVEILRNAYKEAVDSQEFKDVAAKTGVIIDFQDGEAFYNSMKEAYEMVNSRLDVLQAEFDKQ